LKQRNVATECRVEAGDDDICEKRLNNVLDLFTEEFHVPQPDHISALPVTDPEALDEDLQELFALYTEKLGIVPNVLRAYSLRPQELRNFIAMYSELMLAPSGLSKIEREMVAVVVSSANRCYYCLVAHGQAVRRLSGDPEPGEMLVMN
jgi:uncharacterized peroxidase-related enzyme